MTKAEHAEKLKEILSSSGYDPSLDEDFDIQFRAEDNSFLLFPSDDDNMFFQMYNLAMINYNPKTQRSKALAICNDINTEYKTIKCLVGKNKIYAKVELFTREETLLPLVIKRSITVLLESVRELRERLKDSDSHK